METSVTQNGRKDRGYCRIPIRPGRRADKQCEYFYPEALTEYTTEDSFASVGRAKRQSFVLHRRIGFLELIS
jgi:hypothetical protein